VTPEDALRLSPYAIMGVIMAISTYGVIAKPNILKKIIALTILADTVNTLAIFIGYRLIEFPWPPVLPSLAPSKELLREFGRRAVDPLPQALVITAVVINVAVTALLAFLAIQAYRLYGTLNHDRIARLKGGKA